MPSKPKNYSPKQIRESKGKRKLDCAMSDDQADEIVSALAEEELEAVPLHSKPVERINQYCGTHLENCLIPLDTNPELLAYLSASYENMDESILKSLEYDPEEDAFTDEEDELDEELNENNDQAGEKEVEEPMEEPEEEPENEPHGKLG